MCLTGRCLPSRFSEHSPATPSAPFLGIFQSGLCWSNLDDLREEKYRKLSLCISKASCVDFSVLIFNHTADKLLKCNRLSSGGWSRSETAARTRVPPPLCRDLQVPSGAWPRVVTPASAVPLGLALTLGLPTYSRKHIHAESRVTICFLHMSSVSRPVSYFLVPE